MPGLATALTRGLPRSEFIDHVDRTVLRHLTADELAAWRVQRQSDREQGRISEMTTAAGLRIRIHDRRTSDEEALGRTPRSLLFDRFYRAKAASAISGVGIGFHLVRELVAMHGGSVEATSVLGEGSTFTERLPRAQPECSLTQTG